MEKKGGGVMRFNFGEKILEMSILKTVDENGVEIINICFSENERLLGAVSLCGIKLYCPCCSGDMFDEKSTLFSFYPNLYRSSEKKIFLKIGNTCPVCLENGKEIESFLNVSMNI